jgi:hypothetical protein
MKIKKQILLPKSSFALANDEDIFINLQLNKTFTDIKTEKINNIFNIGAQYDSERQASLKFCVYGLVESRFIDTGNFIIDAKDSTNLTLHLPKISSDEIASKNLSVRTFELTLDSNGLSRNLYEKTKSAYSLLFEIDRNELTAQDNATISNGGIPVTRTIDFSIIDGDKNIFFTISVPYLFYDLDGNVVSFGSQTADIDDEGNTIEINNDFPFMYDRHWVKQYFDLPAPSFVFLPDKIINAPENTAGEIQINAGLSAGTINLNVAIDQPSPYGLEEATVIVDIDNTIRNPNQDFNFTPQTIKWNVGEQYKTFNFEIFDDKYIESTENVFLKLTNFKYCLPRNDADIEMQINIIDDDVPSQIRFLSGSSVVKNSISAVTISYVFDKPLEVPNQSVVLYYTSNTDAVLGTDFVLDVNNPTATELNVNFNQGDISGSTVITIINKDVYDVDKTIELAFKNQSQNISLSNIGALTNVGPVFVVTVQDSVVTQFSSFVLLNNPVKNIGALRSFKSPDQNNQYTWNADSEIGFGVATLYEISIRNMGDSIVFNNKLIENNSLFDTLVFSAQQLSDIVIDLPSNTTYDKPNKKYKKSKYEFSITSKEQFISNENSNFGFGFGQNYDYSDIVIDTEKDAGPSGSSKYYLTTKLISFYLNYDTAISACTIDGTFNVVDFAYTNDLVFMGYNQFANSDDSTGASLSESLTNVTFESNKISAFCSQFFPFGFGNIPNPPYKNDYININFRNVYTQSNTPLTDYNNLKFDSTSEIDKKGFLKWSDSSTATKHALMLSVLNNSDISVIISGQTILSGEEFTLRGFEQEINDLSIMLPTNESFSESQSGFTIANYIISVDNVNYYSSNGQASGSSVNFQFNSTNTLLSGPLSATPQYFIVSEYSNMVVPYSNGTVDCTSSVFTNNSNTQLINVAVRGLLLPNSKSGFKRGYFVSSNNDLILTCINESITRIPFAKI